MIISGAQGAELREAQDPYQDHHFGPEMVPLGSENTIPWHVIKKIYTVSLVRPYRHSYGPTDHNQAP
jgi:hypothetical protein